MLPLVAALINAGLPILGNAVLSKGKELVEEKIGITLPDLSTAALTPEQVAEYSQKERDNALELAKLALEERKAEIADVQDARNREIEIEKLKSADKPWWLPSFLDLLTLVVVVGGMWIVLNEASTDIKYAIIAIVTMVLQYYYGSTKNSHIKDATINTLTKGE